MNQIKELQRAYNIQNLTQITAQLIEVYRNKNHALIFDIAKACQISNELSVNRLFSKIIQLYHPDMAERLNKEMIELIKSGKVIELNKFTHIFQTQRLLDQGSSVNLEKLDFQEEDIWDESTQDGFQFFEDTNDAQTDGGDIYEEYADSYENESNSYSF